MFYEDECSTEINSFEEYLQFIKNYCETNKRELWYRGHRSEHWDLKPNIYRNAVMDVGPKGSMSRLKYKVINFKKEFLDLKQEILNKDLFDITKLNDFQIMFIAQHYGLLTPILDWTTDPLVALFFALDGYTSKDKEFPVIYILKPGLINEYASISYENETNITKPLCIDYMNNYFDDWVDDLNNSPANHVPIAIFSEMDFSHRICRQSGKFTLHGAVGPLNYKWSSITIEGEKFVDEIRINPKAVEEIKKYLLVLDINKKSIYRNSTPLDDICDDIKDEALKVFEDIIHKTNEDLI